MAAAATVFLPGVSGIPSDCKWRSKPEDGRLLHHKSKLSLKSQFFDHDYCRVSLNSDASHLVCNSSSAGSGSGLLVVARLFGPAIFESSKLKVLFLSDRKEAKHPDQLLPRAYTLTHSDITAKLTLAVSQTINKSQIQGWYNRLQRDEVLAEWKKCQGSMSLHVHCHISGGHWLLDAIAKLRFYIFRKELPVVLQAFRHGDETLFRNHPDLEESLVWVYFHSNMEEFNRVECWGPLREAACKGAVSRAVYHNVEEVNDLKRPASCPQQCNCCAPSWSVIPKPASFQDYWHHPIPTSSQLEDQSSEAAQRPAS